MQRTTAVLLYATSMLLPALRAQAQSRESAMKSVLATEKAFSKACVDTFPQVAFDRYLSADAMIFRPRAQRAINLHNTRPLPPVLTLAWEPEFADMSRAGDFAYTTGPLVSGARRGNSDPTFDQYVNIWRKQKDGRWLAVIHADVRVPADPSAPKKVKWPEAPPAYAGRVGTSQDEKSTLLNADNAFAVAVRNADYSTVIRPLATSDMRLLRSQIEPMIGIDSVALTTRHANVTMWMPLEANVATSADLGYTRGSYVIALPAGGTQTGDYLRIWKRDRNGTWKIALDMLSPGR